ncbi:MAG: tripartite tricarboxylate transporter permease [Candidatus Nanoarchaeia archaeon]|nr:tripartite tricarboxylate transporter permease [Candidatus Nanoarchaeia archaeon]MDD5587842.1 tripartite tricarboxylate transporter permease [Candidatus Nanoarchaeia archaeon]
MIEIIIAMLIGMGFGIFTGICPGVHINLVTVLIISFSAMLLEIASPIVISVFIISMSIVHTFTNAIPAIFLGAPEESTILSVLPGHALLLEGRGYEAVKLTLIGGLLGLIGVILVLPLLIIIIPLAYSLIENIIVYILILISIFLVFRDKQKVWALTFFLISGVLGILVLTSNIKDPLFPLLSGLFGTSGLLTSLKDKVNIPNQEIKIEDLPNKSIFKSVGSGLFASLLCGLLPGLGGSQAAITASSFSKEWSRREWLILVGSIDSIVMFLSIVGLYTINKARSGSIVAIQKLLKELTLNDLILFVGVSLVVGAIATLLTIGIAKYAATLMTKINYQATCIAIIILIVVLCFILSGVFGFCVLVVSTLVGMLPAFKGVGRNHMMGCLLLPVILFFIL